MFTACGALIEVQSKQLPTPVAPAALPQKDPQYIKKLAETLRLAMTSAKKEQPQEHVLPAAASWLRL